jgi:hypothetical protein
MANCKYCGQWAGVASDEHQDCAQAIADGKSLDEIRAMRCASAAPAQTKPLTAWSLFWVIFLALWLFSLTAGLLYVVLKSIASNL